ELHRVLDAAPAPSRAASVVPEALRRLQRFRTRPGIDDGATAPGAVRKRVRHDPAAGVALGAGLARYVTPLEVAPAVRAEVPIALHLRPAGRAPQLGGGDLALTLEHGLASTLPERCAARIPRSSSPLSRQPSPFRALGQ